MRVSVFGLPKELLDPELSRDMQIELERICDTASHQNAPAVSVTLFAEKPVWEVPAPDVQFLVIDSGYISGSEVVQIAFDSIRVYMAKKRIRKSFNPRVTWEDWVH